MWLITAAKVFQICMRTNLLVMKVKVEDFSVEKHISHNFLVSIINGLF